MAREVVPDGSFKLNKLEWSPWKLAIAPTSAVAAGTSGWLPRRRSVAAGMDVGVRNTRLFQRHKTSPAVYELAVQRMAGTKRYVMYVCCADNLQGAHWDTRLLRNAYVNTQIDSVINNGCSVYIRQAPIKDGHSYTIEGQKVTGHQDVKRQAAKLYSYAWCSNTKRSVTRRGVALATKP